MTPKQRQMLIRALMTERLYPRGSEYRTIQTLHDKGWCRDRWTIGRSSITQDGLDALQQKCRPTEIIEVGYLHILLINGLPAATVLPSQVSTMRQFLADQNL
ncbi:hypothetical protein JYP52_01170 [Nitratireductor aquibiodomus]|uniref:hypothetical protein n=1 Tax=Nitratireductor aquibiodomus TaxID=204799 RepID=UPI0019D35BBE|nr:hypothetical protein [Nitratireductor aquibiodomus]MBN7759732.1 hypothetical protein [Nitratireductor aquibiodomus]